MSETTGHEARTIHRHAANRVCGREGFRKMKIIH
ncbi:MAG: hypothetical protein U5R49_27680 [Deltaproteobacteria bacterium]|nr:hypothetical protein [Deltaproteobacteria bacterium]